MPTKPNSSAPSSHWPDGRPRSPSASSPATVFRVRLGPLDKREDAEGQQAKLGEAGYDARMVRVEKNNP